MHVFTDLDTMGSLSSFGESGSEFSYETDDSTSSAAKRRRLEGGEGEGWFHCDDHVVN